MSDSLGRSTSVMAAGTAVSRVLGFVRGMVLAAALGLNSVVADQFALANTLPNILYMLVAGGVVNAVLVPQIVRAYRSGKGQEYADRLLSLSLAILLAITVVATISAPLIIRVAGGAQDPAQIHLATVFAWWCIPQVFFYGLYTLLGQVLNARGSFGPYMWAPVANNVVSILGFAVFLLVFGGQLGGGSLVDPESWTVGPVLLVAGSATLGIVVQALVLIWPLRRIGFRFRPRRDWRGTGLGTAGRVAGWTFAALLAGQLGVLVVTRVTNGARVAGDLSVAGNNAYNYAFLVFMLPHSLVTVSLLTALFTRLSGHAAAQDTAAVRADVDRGLRLIVAYTVIAAAAVSVLALPIARLIAPANAPAESASLAPIIVALTLGLPALGIWSLVQRVHYAYEDARGLFWVQVTMAAVVAGGTVAGRFLLPRDSWVVGAGASIAVSYLLGAVWGGLAVRRRLGTMITPGARGVAVKALAAAAVAVGVGWPLSRLFGTLSAAGIPKAFFVSVLVGGLMTATYAGLLHLMGVREVQEVAGPIVRRLTGVASGARRSMGALTTHGNGSHGEGVPVDSSVGQGTLLAGRFRLEHPLASDLPGAECWTARDQILDRTVRAVLLRSGRVAQAQDAARRAALVNDPRLLRVIDVGDHGGLAYVVTERIAGRDLGQLTAHGPLAADQARAIVGEAAVALEVARRRGVHHLALRPSCVHVTPNGKVVVSGLAMDGELGEHGLGDARSTTRADTVGLVSLLYLTLTGRWPSPGGGRMHDVPPAPLLSGFPVAPAEIVSGVPNDLDTLCSVTLGPYDDGPHSPAELVRELEPWGAITTVEPRVRVTRPSREADTATDTPPVPAEGALPPEVAAALGRVPDEAVDPEPEPVEPEAEESELDGTAPAEAEADAPGEADVEADEAHDEPDDALDEPGTDEPDAPPPPVGDDAETSPVDLAEGRDLTEVATADDFADAELFRDGAVHGEQQTLPVVARQAVLGVGPVAPRRPGTPPPAIPPRSRQADPRVSAATSAPPAVTVPVQPEHEHAHGHRPLRTSTRRPDDFGLLTGDQAAVPARPHVPAGGEQHPPHEHSPFEEIIGVSADLLVRKRFNPTPLVLLLVVIAIAIGLAWAWKAVQAPAGDLMGDGPGVIQPTPTPTDGATDGTTTGPSAPASSQPPTGAAPVIASAVQVDPPPDGDNNEHPELVAAAIDGDPTTPWLSRTYASPTYGMKSGIGYAVTLQAPALVTKVTLLTDVTGGNVEVRATDPSTPTEGTVLASGPLSATTELVLSEPTEATSIVLWFTALPQTADGRNRVELFEVQVS